MTEILYKDISYQIQGACYWVWKELGNSFKESVIENALEQELQKRKLKVERQKQIDVYYEDKKVGIIGPI